MSAFVVAQRIALNREAVVLNREAVDLNRGAMLFDSQGAQAPGIGAPRIVNGGAVTFAVLVRRAPMPSLRDSRVMLGMPSRGWHLGWHPWLSNATGPPLKSDHGSAV
jgi:hypothetical protein